MNEETQYGIPGFEVNNFEHSIIKMIPNPNNVLLDTLKEQLKELFRKIPTITPADIDTIVSQLLSDSTNKTFETAYNKLYNSFINSENLQQVIVQPTLGSFSDGTNIYTNIYFFENYSSELTKENFKIFQNYTIDQNGKSQLCYYTCFNTSAKQTGESYRLHKFSIKNLDVYGYFYKDDKIEHNKVDVRNIEDVIAFLVNADPKTSRGTVTTVKNPTSGS